MVSAQRSVLNQASRWGGRPDISARSALVTILGDSIIPLGGEIWLEHLRSLSSLFGFSDRLVRTSLSRLVAEDWVVGERAGRKSRYTVTALGRSESLAASQRIYHAPSAAMAPPHAEAWLLIFVTELDADQERELRVCGAHPLRRNVFAVANANDRPALDLAAKRHGWDIATASFSTGGPAAAPTFRKASGLDDAEALYRRFIDNYGTVAQSGTFSHSAPSDLAAVGPAEAFALRTMVVHDFRRARLRDPMLPPRLLGPQWPGVDAFAIARSLYRAVEQSAWGYLADLTGLTLDPTSSARHRFKDHHD